MDDDTQRVIAMANAWLLRTGWPTQADDDALANRLYDDWLRDTYVEWATTGRRDRARLFDRLEAELSTRHGEVDACIMLVFYRVFLEVRARREKENRRLDAGD